MRGAAQELTGELDWPPADSELAERLGVTVDNQLVAGPGRSSFVSCRFACARAWEYRTVQISALRQYCATADSPCRSGGLTLAAVKRGAQPPARGLRPGR